MDQMARLLKRDYKLFLLMVGLFLFGIWVGDALLTLSPKLSQQLIDETMKKFAEIAQRIKGAPFYAQVYAIWLNNILASLLVAVWGALIPIIPLGSVFMNGVIIGVFQNYTALHTGLDPAHFFLSLVPHGLLEIPAFAIAMGLAFRLGTIPYRLLWNYYRRKEYLPLFREFFADLRYYGVLVVILFTLAAVIEVGVSPYFLLRLK
jgi:stage II sporulation protein M